MQNLFPSPFNLFHQLAPYHSDNQKQEERYQASILLLLISASIFFNLCLLLLAWVQRAESYIVLGLVVGTIFLLGLFALGRTRYYSYAIYLYLIYIYLFVMVVVIYYRTTVVTLLAFGAAYITSMFRSVWRTLGMALVCGASVLVIAAVVPGQWTALPIVVFYYLVSTLLAILFLRRLQSYETQLQQQTEELRDKESRLRAVLNGSANAFFLLRGDREEPATLRISDINPQAEIQTSLSRSDLLGRQVAQLDDGVPIAAVLKLDRACAAVPGTNDGLFEWQAVDGRIYEYQLIPLSDGLAVSLNDVSLRREVEAQRLALITERERVNLLRDFVGDITHDLMTPITVIKTNLFLLSKSPDAVKQEKYRLEVERQTSRLHKIIADMIEQMQLNDAGVGQLALIVANVVPVLQQIFDRCLPGAHAENKTLSLTLPAESPIMAAIDRDHLMTALFNLLDNAIKYTPAGTAIGISARTDATTLHITVSDNGYGVHPYDLPHIFKPFYRAAAHRPMNSGAGLGLSIARKIVEGHQGQLQVTSEWGRGAAFTISLPLAAATS